MRRRVRKEKESGAALLAVLLLIAVIGAIAAAALDRMTLSRSASANAAAIDQARGYADGAALLALLTIEDLKSRDPDWSSRPSWNGSGRRIALPGGGLAEARVRDAGNCFNLNSLVQGDPRTGLQRRPAGIAQFASLMRLLDIPPAEASRIAMAAADWADSDSVPQGGAEDAAYQASEPAYRAANMMFSGPGELASIAGMETATLRRLLPFICALPSDEMSPINVNSLRPDQAPLLAMLAPGQLDLAKATGLIERRPSSGWREIEDFRRAAGGDLPPSALAQLQTRTSWVGIETRLVRDDA